MDGGIKFDVSANTARFDADMARVANSANTASAKIQQAFSGLGGILAGGAVLAGLKTLMNDFDKVAKVATRFGASAEEIQRVSVAADLAGTSIDTVARVLTKMSVAASDASSGNENLAKAFEKAGINAQQFKNSGLDQQLIILSEAFNRARGNADATNQIIELMGTRAASQMIPLIDNTRALKDEMQGVAVASDDMVRKIEAANDRLTRMSNNLKVASVGGIEFLVDAYEKLGLALADPETRLKAIMAILGGATGNVVPLYEILQTGKTVRELEEIEARATAISQLTREGVFGMDAVRNAELIADRTKEILEQTRGTTQQIGLAEDMTERVVDLEKQKTSELAKQAEQLERQERQRQDAIRSMEAEIALIEAKLTGNKALEESLREQGDFQSALEKTGSFETASNFAATKAAERSAGESQSPQFATSGDRVFPGGFAERADPTQSQRVSQMRSEAAADRNMARFNELMEGRQFRSAARVEERARRAADRISTRQQMRDTMADMFDGAGNMGEALRNFENQSRKAGMSPDDALGRMGVNRGVGESRRDALERFINEQAKTPEERRMQEQQEQAGGKGGGGGQQNALTSIVRDIKSVLDELNKKLPQSALA